VDIGKRNIPICFSSDERFLPHFLVSLISFLKTNQGNHTIVLLHEGLPSAAIEKVKTIISKESHDSVFKPILVASDAFTDLKGFDERLGLTTFHRLLLPAVLPEEFEFALYLDSDVVVTSALELSTIPLGKHPIYAVKDPSSDQFAPKRGLDKMFNAGVILIDLKQWREKDFLSDLLKYKPTIFRLADQELLNGVFKDSWYELPITYNVNNVSLKKVGGELVFSGMQKPVIIHFMGMHKPWKYWTPGGNLYWKHIWQTPYRWNILRIPFTLINKVKWSINYRINQWVKKRKNKS